MEDQRDNLQFNVLPPTAWHMGLPEPWGDDEIAGNKTERRRESCSGSKGVRNPLAENGVRTSPKMQAPRQTQRPSPFS